MPVDQLLCKKDIKKIILQCLHFEHLMEAHSQTKRKLTLDNFPWHYKIKSVICVAGFASSHCRIVKQVYTIQSDWAWVASTGSLNTVQE